MEKKLNTELYIKDLETRVTDLAQEVKSFQMALLPLFSATALPI